MPSEQVISLICEKLGLKPSKEQWDILCDMHRTLLVKGGWRAGKSLVTALKLQTRYWLGDLFAIIGADYELCRPEFGYLVEFGQRLGILKDCHFPSRDQCTLTLSRGEGVKPAVIETKSAKYPEKIAGKAYDGILLVEAAQMSHEIFIMCQGRLAEKRGWMMMSGTLETALDWYSDKARDYELPDNPDDGVVYGLPSWANLAVFPTGKEDPELVRQEAILGHDLYIQRYGGEVIKPKDLVLPVFKSTLHTGHFPYDKKEPVYVGIDPGYYPSVYAIEFIQYKNDEVYVFDELYYQHLITEQMIKMVQDKPFYDKIEGGAIDVIATRHPTAQKPVVKEWETQGRLSLKAQRILVEDGVDRIRSFFIPNPVRGNVRIHINNSCRGLISELGGCKSPFADEGRGSWRNKPNGQPDEKNCCAIKALIYEVVRRYGLSPKRRGGAVSYLK